MLTDAPKLAAALVACQSELSNPTKDGVNPHFKSKYVTLATVVDLVRDVFAAHGITVIQELTTQVDPAGQKTYAFACVTTQLVHESGETASFGPLRLPVDLGDARGNLAQAVCAASTYARRYALMAVAGLAPDDDDGNGAGEPPSKPAATPVDERAKPGEVQSAVRIEARRLFGELPEEKQRTVAIQFEKSVRKTLKNAGDGHMARLQMLCRAAALTNEQHARLTELLQTNVLDLIQCSNGDIETINELIKGVAK